MSVTDHPHLIGQPQDFCGCGPVRSWPVGRSVTCRATFASQAVGRPTGDIEHFIGGLFRRADEELVDLRVIAGVHLRERHCLSAELVGVNFAARPWPPQKRLQGGIVRGGSRPLP